MTIYIGHHGFSGPLSGADQVEERAGLFALITAREKGWEVRELGQATNLHTAVASALRKPEARGALVAVDYTPGVQRSGRDRLLESIRRAMGASAIASGSSAPARD